MSAPTLEPVQIPELVEPSRRIVSDEVVNRDLGDAAAALSAGYKLTPDPWQLLILKDWMAESAVGRWAHMTCGLSVSRQNGKNAVIEMRELFGLVALGEKILHTAHEVKTARLAFARLQYFFGEKPNDPNAQFPELNKLVKTVRRVNGQEAIILVNGGSVEISARSKNTARGYTVDLIVFDEAQHLADDQLEAMLATTSAAPQGNPQWIFTGTPPGPLVDGEVFTRTRNDIWGNNSKRSCWHEWSAPDGCDYDDPEVARLANPALGYRLQMDVIEAERSRYSDEGYARERLGMWSQASSNRVISHELWEQLRDPRSLATDRFALGFDVSPDMASASVVLAGQRGDGRWHVDVGAHMSGSDWVASWIKRFLEENPQVRTVVTDVASPAATIIQELEGERIKVQTLRVRDVGVACVRFVNHAQKGDLRHLGDSRLSVAVDNGRKRIMRTIEMWAWNRKDEDSDITPLVAATWAIWGAEQLKPKRPIVRGRNVERRGSIW